jgi:hypothetical protein
MPEQSRRILECRYGRSFSVHACSHPESYNLPHELLNISTWTGLCALRLILELSFQVI